LKSTSAASVCSVNTGKFDCVTSLREYTADILATTDLPKTLAVYAQPHRPHRRPNRPQAKSISATCRYRLHNINHKKLVNQTLNP